MIRCRSKSVMAAQPAISESERAQPAHRPVAASITHTLMQGVSIGLDPRRGMRFSLPPPAGM